MGFRFRKSKKIAPGLQVNATKNGIGVTAGGKVARVNVSPTGRVSAGASIPGTGISYTEQFNGKTRHNYSTGPQGAAYSGCNPSQNTDLDISFLDPRVKVCSFCGSEVGLAEHSCPHCLSKELEYKCPICGCSSTSTICESCLTQAYASWEQETKARADRARANQGLVWKFLLTLFMPYIGGYFLITPFTKMGFRVFGIVWCALIALYAPFMGEDALVSVLVVIASLLPIGVYIFKLVKSKNSTKQGA